VIGIGSGASGRLSPGATLLWVTAAGNWSLGVVGDKGTAVEAAGQIGQRVHVACVRTDAELRLFVAGRLAGSRPLAANQPRGRIILGGGSFTGLLDQVRVSKTPRYDKDFTPPKRFEPDADTIALYCFDEGRGELLKDSSGNKRHGKIMGAKWVKKDGSAVVAKQP
jgi:hypothetical protein